MPLARLTLFFIGAFFIATVFVVLVFLMLLSPKHIKTQTDVLVSRGESLHTVSLSLKDAGIIRSALAFQMLVLLKNDERNMVAGMYRFTEAESARTVADRLSRGEFGTDIFKVTFPEGTTVKEMAAILSNRIPGFDTQHFLEIAIPLEGYLFPDTYFFHNDVTPEEVIKKMQDNFAEKTKNIQKSKLVANHSFKDIIIMASILEEEASTKDARSIVSGILWSRLDEGLPLQVDASFLYIEQLEGRDTYTLTAEDLAIDSPYNTYIHKGLPPTPITNPGLESIEAAFNPVPSDYLFYLSDTKGNMYYAKTFEEHVRNRQFLGY